MAIPAHGIPSSSQKDQQSSQQVAGLQCCSFTNIFSFEVNSVMLHIPGSEVVSG